jgi:hypothetical protein
MNQDTHQKVKTTHLKRNAYLYIRQSTLRQVFENSESTKRQYALRQKAVALGWPSSLTAIWGSQELLPPTGKAFNGWLLRSAWDERESCWGWRRRDWRATRPTGIGCWRSALSPML